MATALDSRVFDVQLCLGRGGFGEVYLAEVHSPGGLRQQVAVKVLQRGLDAGSQAVQRLRDEARLQAMIQHRAIVAVHDLIKLDESIALVTEYVDGEDLSSFVADVDSFPVRCAVEIVAEVADALDTAWGTLGPDGRPLELVHRDIKPSNIRVGRRADVKVLDFGIARGQDAGREARTQTDQVFGSFPYMAPERFLGENTERTSDVFALGCVLYECLTGQAVFCDVTVAQLFRLAINQEAHERVVSERLGLLDDNLDEGVRSLVRDMMVFDCKERITVDEVAHRAEDLLSALPGTSLRRWCRAREWPKVVDAGGPLVGKTVTESRFLTPTLDTPIAAPRVPHPEADTAGFLVPGAAAPESVERPASPSEPEAPPAVDDTRQVPVAPVPEPAVPDVAPASSKRGLWIGAAVVAVLVFFVVGAGGAAVALAAAGGLFGGGTVLVAQEEPGGTSPESVDQATGNDPVAAADLAHEIVDTRDASGGVPSGSSAAPTTQAVVELDSAPPPETDAIPVACDPGVAQRRSAAGSMDAADQACLRAAMMDTSLKLTERDRYGRAVIEHRWKACRDAGSCAGYEEVQRYFLEHIGQYDPSMMLAWARYVHDRGHLDLAGCDDVIKWSGRALDEKHRWKGAAFVENVAATLRVRALAAQRAWQLVEKVSPKQAVDRRVAAREFAVEWLGFMRDLGRPASEAEEVCALAAGSAEDCEKRVDEAAADITVTIGSDPVGADVFIDGKQVGRTPFAKALRAGRHTIELKHGEMRHVQRIKVEGGGPSRFLWVVADGSWVAR